MQPFNLPIMLFRKLLIILMLNGMFISVQSQQLSDSAIYNTGIKMLGNSKTANDYKQAAAYFEDFSAKYPSHWLGLYYAALCCIHASHQLEEDKDRDSILDKAQTLIDKARNNKPDESEMLVLQAFLYQSRIEVNPKMRGMTYSSKAEASLNKSTEANDKNPRAWSLLGYNLYYTPVLFGGGAEKSLPLFLKARDKYKAFKPLMPFYPHWGESENQHMISECRKPK
jgi:tetratricopeptide (TPR) repeat protein